MENLRKYHKNECVSFLKTNEEFGGFSNMASGYPIKIPTSSYSTFYTSEALYQAARFPDQPLLQKFIAKEVNPITAKRSIKEHITNTRSDWFDVRIPIMRWCLRAKLICNWNKFSRLLLRTQNLPIVEISYRDQYWGAKPDGDYLLGQNLLGRLLMEIKKDLIENNYVLEELSPLDIQNFKFFDSIPPTLILKDMSRMKDLELDKPPRPPRSIY